MNTTTRRQILRGMLGGSAVSVALPLLDCFLNGNGTALADDKPMPVRFGTWNWGLGMNRDVFVPKKVGADFDLPEEIASLAPIRDKINLYTNFNPFLDGAPNLCHRSGWQIVRTGKPPRSLTDRPGETIDVTIANKIGSASRFLSITATASGDARDTWSFQNADSSNASEPSPLALYKTIFGPDYQDPNAAEFRPNPTAMVRKSVLSGVMGDTKKLQNVVGASDKARLDQYFTGLRDLERQLQLQLTKPEPREACRQVAEMKAAFAPGLEAEQVAGRHKLITDLMVMAVACDQTRVFNMNYSAAFAATTKAGYEKPHHAATHEEPIDVETHHQIAVSWFTRRAMEQWAYYVNAFASVKEGDATLLDNMLIFASSDHAFAKIHTLEGLPMFTAGRAGGKLKTGIHVDGAASPSTRLGYTAMKTMGLDLASWGVQSNYTNKEIGEVLV